MTTQTRTVDLEAAWDAGSRIWKLDGPDGDLATFAGHPGDVFAAFRMMFQRDVVPPEWHLRELFKCPRCDGFATKLHGHDDADDQICGNCCDELNGFTRAVE